MRSSLLNSIKLITLDDPYSVHAEMYRTIRTNLIYTAIDKEINVINVTSTVANEAKTTTTCNIAVMTANNQKKVLIIDLDLRNPSVHRAFNVKNENGITDLLVDYIKNGENVDVSKYIIHIEHERIVNDLYVLPSGTGVINPIEILSSQKLKDLMKFLSTKFDKIIIDSSPSGVISDGLVTSNIADGTIYVIESGKTKIEVAQKTIKQLTDIGVNILGAILTKVRSDYASYSYYDYGYYASADIDNKERIKVNVD